jgi:hypothetical protein
MPTDLGEAQARKRKAAQAQAQTDKTILLVFVIVVLARCYSYRACIETASHAWPCKISRFRSTATPRSLRLDIMPRKRGTAGHSSHLLYNLCK